MVQLSASRCSCIAILLVSLVSFASITLYVASQRVFVIYFIIDSVKKLLDTPSNKQNLLNHVRMMEGIRHTKQLIDYQRNGRQRPGRPLRRLLDGYSRDKA
jgi:hypothetical protein